MLKVKAVLFDLDGTLLPLDQDEFIQSYFKALSKKFAGYGFEPKAFISALLNGVVSMVKNDGSCSNEKAFWETFSKDLGTDATVYEAEFEEFYKNEFQKIKELCGYNEKSLSAIKILKEKGIKCVLATAPLFPKIATESRIRWAGLEPDDFELYTTFEICSYSKPNVHYYEEILKTLSLSPEECIMVGNDVKEDMAAIELGMGEFLLTDCLLNRENADYSHFRQGNFDQLLEFLKSL